MKEFSESANETGTPQERELKSKYFEITLAISVVMLRGVRHMFTFQKKKNAKKKKECTGNGDVNIIDRKCHAADQERVLSK